MIKLNSLPTEKQLELVYSSEKLTKRLESIVEENCEFTLFDYLNPLEGVEYSFGMYDQKYLRLKASGWSYKWESPACDFLSSLEKLNKDYCFSDKIEKKLEQCKKLYFANSNLWEWHVGQLATLYEEFLVRSVKYYEDVHYDIHCRKNTSDLREYVEIACFDDVYVREDDKLVSEVFYT